MSIEKVTPVEAKNWMQLGFVIFVIALFAVVFGFKLSLINQLAQAAGEVSPGFTLAMQNIDNMINLVMGFLLAVATFLGISIGKKS